MAREGSQKFAVLLCKFSDSPEEEFQPSEYFEDLIVKRRTGGLNDYWVDASLGKINLDGSKVFGWKTLEIERQSYIAQRPSRWDKIQGAIQAFSISMSDWTGVIAVFAEDPGDSAAEGSGVLVPPQNADVTFLAHETGHLFGLGHSFDQSDRKLIDWSAPGEYYDRLDIMSAMNVDSFTHERFGAAGPLLNAALLDQMEWLPEDRVWTLPSINRSDRQTIDLVSLSRPDIPGFLAARIGSLYVEFRTREKWDAGIKFDSLLLHRLAGGTSVVLASDAANHVNEWQQGQVYGDMAYQVLGGTRIQIERFDHESRKARIRVDWRAARPMVTGPALVSPGVGVGGGGYIILPGGRRVPIGPDSPLLAVLETVAIAGEAEQRFAAAAAALGERYSTYGR